MGLSPPSRDETPLKGAPIVVCARTSLAVGSASYDARRQARAYALRHHSTPYGELVARDTSGGRVVRGMHRTLAASSR